MEMPLTQTLGQFRDRGAAWAAERRRKASKLDQEDRWRAEFGRQLEVIRGSERTERPRVRTVPLDRRILALRM